MQLYKLKMYVNSSYLCKRLILKDVRNSIKVLRRSHWKSNSLPELDLNYLCEQTNFEEITNNINLRKGVGNIKLVNDLKTELDATNWLDQNYEKIKHNFYEEALKIPNKTHPNVSTLLNEPSLVKYIGEKKIFNFAPREFDDIAKRLGLVRTSQLGNVNGNRSYYFLGELAELEKALIRYTVNNLLQHKFQLISVPDILHRNVIEACGMNTKGTRTQVYTLDESKYGSNLCLSGTSEMALAGYFANKVIPEEDLPLKVAAISRCYRAEVSNTLEEKGIYRVHEFTKVEMFGLCTPETADDAFEEFRSIQENHFDGLGLHLQILDMPPHELGASAYRKYDIEAWLPGRKIFGEISSCSNCTDFQSRRLNIKYKTSDGELKHVHTLNGTACAVPRMLIALVETYQTDKGIVEVPSVLQKFMRNKTSISRQKKIPELKLIKNKI